MRRTPFCQPSFCPTLLLAVLLPAASSATTLTVTNLADSGPGSLREAILQAADGDTIEFSVSGTIRLSEQLAIANDLAIEGPGADQLELVGKWESVTSGRVLRIADSASVRIRSLTIRDGSAFNSIDGDSTGGGVLNFGQLELEDVILLGNRAQSGSGIANHGILVVRGSSFEENGFMDCIQSDGASALLNTGSAEISDSWFSRNRSAFCLNRSIKSEGDLTIQDSTFQGMGFLSIEAGSNAFLERISIKDDADEAQNLGIINHGYLEMYESEISGLRAFAGFTGICSTGYALIVDSHLHGNSSFWPLATDYPRPDLSYLCNVPFDGIANTGVMDVRGTSMVGYGPVFAYGGLVNTGTLRLTNSTISAFKATPTYNSGGFGGVYNVGSMQIASSTITQNGSIDTLGTTSGAIWNQGHIEIQNTIVADQVSAGGLPPQPDCVNLGTLVSYGHNLDSDGTCGLTGPGDLTADPLLGPLAHNGGPTPTHALLAGSPALDAGSPQAPGSSSTACPTIDQRGIARTGDGEWNGSARCDIGAYELRTDCSDMVDNDGDGRVDRAHLFDCLNPSDLSEALDCQDGLDNDGDGAIDTADTGCPNAHGALENPQCADGLDNDGDGAADYPADTLCTGVADNDEAMNPACGLGPELAFVLAGLLGLRRRVSFLGCSRPGRLGTTYSCIAVAVLSFMISHATLAADFVVDTTEDLVDATPGDSECAATTGACSLRAAVMEANTLIGPDRVELPPGEFRVAFDEMELDDGDAAAAAVGDLDIVDDLVLVGNGQNLTTIRPGRAFVAFEVRSGSVEIRALTIDGTDDRIRGAVLNAGQLLLDEVTVSHFRIGPYVRSTILNTEPGHLILLHSQIVNNSASFSCGAIASSGGHVTIDDGAIQGNVGTSGAICQSAGELDISRSRIVDNRGAEYVAVLSSGGGHFRIVDSLIIGNIGYGLTAGPGEVVSSTVTRNTHFGLNPMLGALAISGSTITDNFFVYGRESPITGPGTGVTNSIIAGSTAVDSPPTHRDDCPAQSLGYNLLRDCASSVLDATDRAGTVENPLDPLLRPLADNGGPTWTQAPLAGSPALDAGSPEVLGSSSTACPTVDQRGVARSGDGDWNGSARCDIGAYELRTDCSDMIDNDGDGRVDKADIFDCLNPSDVSETLDCQDGIDNDGDGATDTADTGCPNALGAIENPQCADGLDNDGDGAIDYPTDTLCTGVADNDEARNPACGLGPELALAIGTLLWLPRRWS